MTMKITKLGIMLLLLLAVGGCQTDAVSSGQPAKSPQQLLAEQPIDDAHDAFLVDTGGRLGTLLVTAELTAAYKDEFGTQDITFAVWDPADPAQPLQTFTEEVMLGIAPEYHQVVDANFDGFLDFGYLFHAGNQPCYYHFWLWNEQQREFTYCAPMVEISAPAFDEERQLVTEQVTEFLPCIAGREASRYVCGGLNLRLHGRSRASFSCRSGLTASCGRSTMRNSPGTARSPRGRKPGGRRFIYGAIWTITVRRRRKISYGRKKAEKNIRIRPVGGHGCFYDIVLLRY